MGHDFLGLSFHLSVLCKHLSFLPLKWGLHEGSTQVSLSACRGVQSTAISFPIVNCVQLRYEVFVKDTRDTKSLLSITLGIGHLVRGIVCPK